MPVNSMFHAIIRPQQIDARPHSPAPSTPVGPSLKLPCGMGDGEALAGKRPRRPRRLGQAWIETRCDELPANWLSRVA
ncbi:MAG TPA: DUF4160 domain-containing protein [Anaerolineae bacterium]|nr:DUF4160 domain-containing protein [Anaerolineae bacterium]HNU04423.1 DUF4160 domain-containing protein [Anaerolineae bacterium]